MNSNTQRYLEKEFNILKEIIEISNKVEDEILEAFKEIDRVKEYNQYKVIKAFQENRVSDTHFGGTTGYIVLFIIISFSSSLNCLINIL